MLTGFSQGDQARNLGRTKLWSQSRKQFEFKQKPFLWMRQNCGIKQRLVQGGVGGVVILYSSKEPVHMLGKET